MKNHSTLSVVIMLNHPFTRSAKAITKIIDLSVNVNTLALAVCPRVSHRRLPLENIRSNPHGIC